MMKRTRCILLLIALLAIIIVLIVSPNIAKDHDGVFEILLKDLQLPQGDAYNVTFAGEFKKDAHALLWYIIETPTENLYYIAECKLLPGNHYYFKEALIPKTYSKDIVSLMWKTEYLFLINDIRCRTISFGNRNGETSSQVDFTLIDYPYLYHHTNETARTITFRDEYGNSIS